jgi:carboxyl-terminal processing protease
MRRCALIVGVLSLVLAGPFALGYRLSQADRATKPVALPVLDQVREALAGGYYRHLSPRVLRLSSVNAMLHALHDPYTAYLDPPAYRLARQATASTYTGIGISVLPTPAGLVVVDVRNGPAAQAGVRLGDTIATIDGRGATLARMSGAMGSDIDLHVVRRGGVKIDVRLRRERVHVPTVQARLLSFRGARWGDLRITSFRAGAAQLMARQIALLKRRRVRGFVLDLRGDPGGLVYQAVGVSSLFLERRSVVVKLVGARGTHEVLVSTGRPETRLPVVVLVDHYTASSAEILAGALQDNRRAVIVGQRTYGKAVVQQLDPLANGAALELTVARYFTPAGDDISHVGLDPLIRAVDDPRTRQDEALNAALRVLAQPTS